MFGFVAIFVGAFTIFNTLSITVAQRSREFGLLRMVGAMRRQVLGSVLLEALALGLLASLVGLGVGFGVAKGLDAIFRSMDLALPDAGTVFATRTIVVSMLVGTLVTLVAGLIPAWRATRVPPVAALRDADPGAHKVRLPARAVRGMASVIGRVAERVGGSAGALARRNAMRHPGRTAVTASALMIGVALVTLVTVIAQGLRDTTTGTLENRINATHVITGSDGWSPTDPSVAKAVAATPGVEGVTSIRQDTGLVFGDKEIVNSVDPATAPGRFSFVYASGSADAVAGLGKRRRDRRRGPGHRAPPEGGRLAHGHLGQGHEARAHGQGDREVAGARRARPRPGDDLTGHVRGRVREQPEPAHAGLGGQPGSRDQRAGRIPRRQGADEGRVHRLDHQPTSTRCWRSSTCCSRSPSS